MFARDSTTEESRMKPEDDRMPRRKFFSRTGAALAAAAALEGAPTLGCLANDNPPAEGGDKNMPYELPPLPYAFNALEPHIDAMTMQIHHDKHHGAYVDNLNKALVESLDLAKKPVEELITM